jgi:hypothetical protein
MEEKKEARLIAELTFDGTGPLPLETALGGVVALTVAEATLDALRVRRPAPLDYLRGLVVSALLICEAERSGAPSGAISAVWDALSLRTGDLRENATYMRRGYTDRVVAIVDSFRLRGVAVSKADEGHVLARMRGLNDERS